MPYGLYISAEGALAQSQRMDVIAHNLANVDTVGFKREQTAFQARLSEAVERGLDVLGSKTINDMGGGVMLRSTHTDHSTGVAVPTGRATDMAIEGEGFFVVEKNGEELLTRAGNFIWSTSGELVTPQGYRVLGDDGSPITYDPALGPPQGVSGGGIAQQGAVRFLRVVKPGQSGDLSRIGENLFRPLAPTRPLAPSERRVFPGYIERSTVKPTVEMMEMIEATRAFEANVTQIRQQDQMLGNLVSRMLRTE